MNPINSLRRIFELPRIIEEQDLVIKKLSAQIAQLRIDLSACETSEHDHGSDYACEEHDHGSDYAGEEHNHDSDYASKDHEHHNGDVKAEIASMIDDVKAELVDMINRSIADHSHKFGDDYSMKAELRFMIKRGIAEAFLEIAEIL